MNLWPIRIGLLFGAAVAALHALWAALVFLGWAQPVADFVFWLHFIRPLYTILPFDLGRAGLLVLFSGAVSIVAGWLLASLWLACRPKAAAGL